MRRKPLLCLTAAVLLALSGCGAGSPAASQADSAPTERMETETSRGSRESSADSSEETELETETSMAALQNSEAAAETPGLHAEQLLPDEDGTIHYSYYLPESYDGTRTYPMMVVMPGYDMMWFGEDSSGSNINWSGFQAWTKLDTEMIVVSAQLTDWH